MPMKGLEGLLERRAGFLGACPDLDASRAVLFGAPMDFTVTYRPGSRLAPSRVREASDVLEEHSLALGEDLADHPFFDAGDVSLAWGNVSASLEAIGRVAREVVRGGRIPLMIGGEHLVTWPVVDAVADTHPDLVILHFDAHADLRGDYMGEKMSHATAIRLCAEKLPPRRVYQFGIRSGTADEVAYARERTNFFPGEVLRPLREALQNLGDAPIYVTIDIDVVDPAFAPGTGTPEPGGVSSGEIIQAVHLLRGRRVVGFDVVEICPPMDHSERTAILGAKLLREAILSFC